MKKNILILLLVCLPFLSFTAHKFYISLINVEYKAEKNTVQVTMRVFIDDLQKAINETNNTSLELAVKDEPDSSNVLIFNYINDNFKININSKLKTYNYIGKEYDNDIAYLYLELVNVKKITEIEITDTMLMDYFPTQKNIVKLMINDTKKTFMLTKSENKDKLTL